MFTFHLFLFSLHTRLLNFLVPQSRFLIFSSFPPKWKFPKYQCLSFRYPCCFIYSSFLIKGSIVSLPSLAADRSNSLQNATWGTPPALRTWSQITRWATSEYWATLSTMTYLLEEKYTLREGRPAGICLKRFLIILIRNALQFILNSNSKTQFLSTFQFT